MADLTLDAATVRDIACRATARPALTLTGWTQASLYGGIGAVNDVRHLVRVAGTGRDDAAEVGWSVVLKWFRPVGNTDTSWLTYWRREAVAYQSGLLDDLPGGVSAPRCFGVVEREDGVVEVWLEDLADAYGEWPIERYALAARHLGQFNGAYLRDRALPEAPWLGRAYLRRWFAPRTQFAAAIAAVRDDPLLARYWTPALVEGTLRLIAERDVLFDAHARLPETFLHGDTGRRNLFARRVADREETVLIDWAMCGIGAVGEDIHQTVVTSAHMFDVPLDWLDDLERRVLDGYLAGLADAGVDVDPRLVRLGYLVPAAIRNTVMPFGTIVPPPEQRRAPEQAFGVAFEQYVERQVAVRQFMLERAERARGLIVDLQRDGRL